MFFQGWRWTWLICAIPGLVLGPLIFFTVKEPVRHYLKKEEPPQENEGFESEEERESLLPPQEPQLKWTDKALMLGKIFMQPTILMLCLGGSIRNAGE